MLSYPPLVTIITFAVCTVLPLFLGDRLYPFSEVGMFSHGYQPLTVITARSPDGRQIHASPRYLGCTTSGLSREYLSAQSDGGLSAFVTEVKARASRQEAKLPAEAWLWQEMITVNRSGDVECVLAPLRRLSDGHLGAGRQDSNAAYPITGATTPGTKDDA